MSRRPRQEGPGAIRHVVPKGNGGRRIVFDDRDRRRYLERFNAIAAERGWIVHASCLLETHHHAVVETPRPDLGRGMGLILGGHAAWLNRRHDGTLVATLDELIAGGSSGRSSVDDRPGHG